MQFFVVSKINPNMDCIYHKNYIYNQVLESLPYAIHYD